jgi:hypothetical protein
MVVTYDLYDPYTSQLVAVAVVSGSPNTICTKM